MVIATVRDYIKLEKDRIDKERWCLGVNLRRSVSFDEAVEHFRSDIYNGLTPEDWFHIDAIYDITQQIVDGRRSLDDQLILTLLKNASYSIDRLWEVSGEPQRKVA